MMFWGYLNLSSDDDVDGSNIVVNMIVVVVVRGGAIGGKGAKAPLKISKKGKMKKYGVFSCIKVIKISFSVIFNEEIHALEGLLSRF